MSPEEPLTALARHYDRLARRYDRALDRMEGWLLGDWRSWAARHARGRTLEIAVGTGRTFPYYPRDIQLIGIDLSPGMLAQAQRRRPLAPPHSLLVRGDAQRLPVRDQSVDVVISILSLCTIPDHERALHEAHRVLVPGGRLVLVEHVRSSSALVRAVQYLLDPLSTRLAHDHLTREPLDIVETLGFRIHEVTRRRRGIVERVLAEKV